MTNETPLTPDERTEARRLLADMLAWGQILRDAQPPVSVFPIFQPPEQRIGWNAWAQLQAAAKRLESLLGSQPETPESEA